jgi:hypothetical protein
MHRCLLRIWSWRKGTPITRLRAAGLSWRAPDRR